MLPKRKAIHSYEESLFGSIFDRGPRQAYNTHVPMMDSTPAAISTALWAGEDQSVKGLTGWVT